MEQGRRTPPQEPALIAAVEPALKAGAACGSIGFLFGGASGIIRGAPGFLFASASGLQTFALGSSFTYIRTFVSHIWTPEGQVAAPRDMVKASALAGGISGGALGLLTRGRSNAFPGLLMFSLFGAGGQVIYNRWMTPKHPDAEPRKNFWKRMSERSWTPFKVLSNAEYAEMLKEKVLKLDVEIAVLDDKILALREQQARDKAAAAVEAKSTTKQRNGSG